MARHRINPTRHRQGTAVVEFAVVFPLFLLLIVGAIDIGRSITVRHTMIEAARGAARLYAVRGLSDGPRQSDVEAAISKSMSDAQLSGYTVRFDPPPSATLQALTPVTVTLSIPYDRVSWGPSWFSRGSTITIRCTMPADVEEAF